MVLMQRAVGVTAHRAKFPDPEDFSVTSNSVLLIEDGAAGYELDYDSNQQKYRGQAHKGCQ